MRRKFNIVLVFFMLVVNVPSFPQCAMCRATVESAAKSGENRAAGLNTGILYMMVFPYIMSGVIAYLWYKHSKKERTERKRVQNRLKTAGPF